MDIEKHDYEQLIAEIAGILRDVLNERAQNAGGMPGFSEGSASPAPRPAAASSKPTPAKFSRSSDPREVIIGVGPAFLAELTATLNGLPHAEVLREIAAGVEEEGMIPRAVKVYKTSDVAFIGKEAAELSGSGVGVGLQSKGTAVIHRKDLYPLTNLELFPQAPLMTLAHYRQIGQNAARYAKGERVKPMKVLNDPMTRASYQVKAALMHNRETALADTRRPAEDFA
ncbi:MAG: hypothetical protein FWC55_08400 [Firmicutes bacterium]|nr:hypothetical protein [Bacillota bacterium]